MIEKHITFDLETLGSTMYAPIVQIGAVKFDLENGITDRFLRTIKLSSLKRYDFKVDYENIAWWFSQKDEAIKSVFCTENPVDLRLALLDFTKWIGKNHDYYYWSHATFDPPILAHNYNQVGLPKAIPFRLQRDIRTLSHFIKTFEKLERKGIHHNALDDCIYQAQYISKNLFTIEECLKKE